MSYPYENDEYYESEETVSHPESTRQRSSRRQRASRHQAEEDTHPSRQTPRSFGQVMPQNSPARERPHDQYTGEGHYSITSSRRTNDSASDYEPGPESGYDDSQDYPPGQTSNYDPQHGYYHEAGRPRMNMFSGYEQPPAPPSRPRLSLGGDDYHQEPQLAYPEHLSSQYVLDHRYIIQPRHYFVPGTVFSILWHENDGRGINHGTQVTQGPQYIGRFGEPIYSSIRRMVVIKTKEHCSWCFSISTYGRKGVAKRGVVASQHAIVYKEGKMPYARHDEPQMTKEPLEIWPNSHDEPLDGMSRLNYGKIYTVEHNVKVLPIGKVSPDSMTKFRDYARYEMEN
ncbi:hypothetical protein BJX99DRAFT_236430 [Aspergillus californicus]